MLRVFVSVASHVFCCNWLGSVLKGDSGGNWRSLDALLPIVRTSWLVVFIGVFWVLTKIEIQCEGEYIMMVRDRSEGF